jgi:PII-like signaling protein
MRTEGQAHLLRIFINESDRWEGRALYEAIVRAAREQGLAGATAMRAIEGFGAGGRIHSVKVLHLSEDVPIVIEVIDTPERIASFLPTIDKIVAEGIVTVEKIHVLTYRRNGAEATPDSASDEIQLDLGDSDPAITSSSPVFVESNDRVREVMNTARESATNSRRAFIDSVDVLLALLGEPKGITSKALTNMAIDCQIVDRSLRETVSRDETSTEFLVALDAKSAAAAKWLDHKSVGTEHLLLALCEIRPSAATDILTRLGAQPRDICKEVLTMLDQAENWQGWLADHPDM